MSGAIDAAWSCPCGSGGSYERCCRRLHMGGEAEHPRELVRARFSAYSLGVYGYVHSTLHSSHEDARAPVRELFAALEKACRRARYKRLTLMDSDGPDADGVARVLFAVEMMENGRDRSFTELSSFARENGGWRYVTGTVVPSLRLEPADVASIAAFEEATR